MKSRYDLISDVMGNKVFTPLHSIVHLCPHQHVILRRKKSKFCN